MTDTVSHIPPAVAPVVGSLSDLNAGCRGVAGARPFAEPSERLTGGLASSSVQREFGSIVGGFCVVSAPVPWRRVQAAWSPRVSRRMTAVL